MSGAIKGEADTLKQLGIDTRVLSTTLGDAHRAPFGSLGGRCLGELSEDQRGHA